MPLPFIPFLIGLTSFLASGGWNLVERILDEDTGNNPGPSEFVGPTAAGLLTGYFAGFNPVMAGLSTAPGLATKLTSTLPGGGVSASPSIRNLSASPRPIRMINENGRIVTIYDNVIPANSPLPARVYTPSPPSGPILRYPGMNDPFTGYERFPVTPSPPLLSPDPNYEFMNQLLASLRQRSLPPTLP